MDAFMREFYSPGDEYSPCPFWFLNGDLSEQKLEAQLNDFVDKGVMNVILHPRMGLSKRIGYLTDEYMRAISFCVRTAGELGMRVILYDEGMYPSGSAHGGVVRENPEYAAKGIRLLTPNDIIEPGDALLARVCVRMRGASAYEAPRALGAGDAAREGETELRIVKCFTLGTIRGVHAGEDDGEAGAPRAADILNPDAVKTFIRLTHDKYFAALGDEFGKVIMGFFTDEPDMTGRRARAGVKPWTDGLETELFDEGVLLTDLPALWLDAGARETERVRGAYGRVLRKRLMSAYYAQLADWCDTHNVLLCGHPESAEDIDALSAFHIPGQDVVWRWVAPEDGKALYGAQSTQAKCASDAARHTGRRRNLNECCGCCGPDGEMWAFTPDDFKWYLDWLFARGCNMIVPHAFYYEADTPLKRDRPPDLGPNNFWWQYFERFSDYIRRMCMLNTNSVNLARVAVLCAGDHLPYKEPAELYRRQIEFNYLPESLLPDALANGKIVVRKQKYDALLIEEGFAFSQAALDKARALGSQGLLVCARADEIPDEYKVIRLSGDARELRASRLKRGKAEYVILINEGEREYAGEAILPFTGAIARLDAWNGRAERVDTLGGSVNVRLNRRESVVFATGMGAEKLPEARITPPVTREIALDSGWALRLPDGGVARGLADWRDIPAIANFSGELEYECELNLPAAPARAILDLGVVWEIASVYVNGMRLNDMLFAPYCAEAGGCLCAGKNEIRVRVTNSRVPMYAQKPWRGGLMGPVTLKLY